jgi:hypothetical protein
MRDQPAKPVVRTKPTQVAGTVETVVTGVGDHRRIADVVQPGRCDQQVLLFGLEHMGDAARFGRDRDDVRPPPRKDITEQAVRPILCRLAVDQRRG